MRRALITLFGGMTALLLLAGCSEKGTDTEHSATDTPAAVSFATDGHLKMLYDNRMHPAAIEYEGKIYIAWRGVNGWPQMRTYDLESRMFSERVNILDGLEDVFDLDKYTRDQHYNPVIWMSIDGHFQLIAGCHGNRPGNYNDCDKMKTKVTGDIYGGWEKVESTINISVNYPKVYRIYGDQTLMHFRNTGHLGSWTYRLSPDGEQGWHGPEQDVVDMSLAADPAVSCLDFHAGSYHGIRISKDGKTLHDAFIGTQQDFRHTDCEAPANKHYGELGDDRRYNLYYVKVDLRTGQVYNYAGKELTAPVSRGVANTDALIYDTDERIFAVVPSIHLDENDQPYFLGEVSDETPFRGWFTFVYYEDGEWKKTKVARTSHYFNAAMLDRNRDGDFRALLIVGDGEAKKDNRHEDIRNLNRYGWGDRVEEWISKDGGATWKLSRDITPVEGYRYQNIKRVSTGIGESSNEIFLFYGWQPDAKPGEAVAFLWDDR